MIKAIFYQNKAQQYYAFKLLDHANYAEYGNDIICSAVSATAQAVIMTLLQKYKQQVNYQLQAGQIECNLFDFFEKKVNYTETEQYINQQIINALIECVYNACQGIVKAYGKQYIKLIVKMED